MESSELEGLAVKYVKSSIGYPTDLEDWIYYYSGHAITRAEAKELTAMVAPLLNRIIITIK